MFAWIATRTGVQLPSPPPYECSPQKTSSCRARRGWFQRGNPRGFLKETRSVWEHNSRFEPIGFACLQSYNLLLDFNQLRNEWILHFLELIDVQGGFCEGS